MAALAAVRGTVRVASRRATRLLRGAAHKIRWPALCALVCCAAVAIATIELTRQAGTGQFLAEHTTSAGQPPLLINAGPRPGPLLPLWQVTTLNGPDHAQGGQIDYGLVDGQLVIVSGAGIDVRDARTGAQRWYYTREGWTLTGWAATRAEIATYFQRGSARPSHLLVVLDAASGQTLWHSGRDMPVGIEPGSLRWLSGPDTFLVSSNGHVIRGVAARAGTTLWSRSLATGCGISAWEPYGSAGDAATVDVFSAMCGPAQRLVAIDPARGRIRWQVRPASIDAAAVAVQHGITAVWDGEALQIVSSSGRRLLRDSGDELCDVACQIAVSGQRVILAYSPDGTHHILQAIDIHTAGTDWLRPANQYQAMTDAGGRVYALSSTLADGLIPAALDAVDPVTGQTTTVPLPMAFRPGAEGRPWLAAAGGLIFAAYPLEFDGPAGGYRVMALRSAPAGPGPTTLDGVPRQDWPSACRLVTAQDLAGVLPAAAYVQVPGEVSVAGLRVDAGCEYRPYRAGEPDEDAASVDVVTGWVAPDRAQARQLLADVRATYQRAERLPAIGDEAYGLGAPAGPVAVRVGRVIVMVRADQNLVASAQLARTAALRLRQDGY